MPGRVERQPTGWYETSKERFVTLLQDVYRPGFVADFRSMTKRLDDLERRGA